MGRIRRFLRRSLAFLRGSSAVGVSEGYRPVAADAVARTGKQLESAWRDDAIPQRQRQLVDGQLADYRAGRANAVFDALVDVLRDNVTELDGADLLEIGCSSGYYSEVLALRGINLRYSGCDFSEPFIRLARNCYPQLCFDVEDAVRLSYADSSFDIVVSGCCILHIAEYEKAIAEAARVAGRYVVFHRTPVLHGGGPAVYTKKAYGVDTMEIHFNEQSLVRSFQRCGMAVIDVNTHSVSWDSQRGDALAMKTYLCRKL